MRTRCRRGFDLTAGAVIALVFALAPAAWAADPPCPDNDGDGYVVCTGSCDSTGKTCGECDDSHASVHPGAPEICDGLDNNCDGTVDNLVDPHVIFPPGDPHGTDVHFGFCVYAQDGPANECKTAGQQECHQPPGPVTVNDPTFGLMTCVLRPGTDIIHFTPEDIADGDCNDGVDNDCDNVTDIHDPGCQSAEICDGLDNDGNGVADNGFNVGAACTNGVGACERNGFFLCKADHTGTVCGAQPGAPKTESAGKGNTCGDGIDNDCDGKVDLADEDCAGFGVVELCNGIDDDGDGQIDEGFALGVECSVGLGACSAVGHTVCKPDGTGTQCSATPGVSHAESVAAGNCHDFVDNDCNGLTDAKDPACSAAFSDLGVTCSLPFRSGKNGNDCQGKNILTFSGGSATEVKADLLGLAADGSLLGIIEDVQNGEEAQLGSRNKAEIDTKKNRYKLFVPIPLLRVTGKRDGVEDVAYCGILPFLDVTKPDGETISLSEGKDMDVRAYIPLVNVDTLGIKLDGVNVLQKLGINPVTAFPTVGTALCTTPGSCVFQITAGCGDGSLVNVEIRNLRVEGLDTSITPDARNGIDTPNQVNTVSFTASGLPAGGHIFYITGNPLPLPRNLATPCNIDDLADTGKMSAFGINVTAPTSQEIVASAPVHVEGTACGGNQIDSVKINGKSLDVTVPTHQTCTTGNGTTSTSECFVHFNEAIPEKSLADAAVGGAENASYKRGSNRVIADATDVTSARTFNTDVVFGLGSVQAPGTLSAMQTAVGATKGDVAAVANQIMTTMAAEIDPAFVVGLEETAVQKFFNEKCSGAIDQFSDKAREALNGKTFATFDVEPDCSCDLHVPIILKDLNFPHNPADPACAVDFKPGVIDVKVNLPDVHIEVGADDSCTDHGIFGECIARTKVHVRAVVDIKGVSFAFTITEGQIETKTVPDVDSFLFTWGVFDNAGRPAFSSLGSCSGGPHPGRDCFGDSSKLKPGQTGMCGAGGTCVGFVANKDFDPVTSKDVGIECWGADICLAFEFIAAIVIDIFTFGLVDGFDLIGFLDFDFQFNQDFLSELTASQPDAMELNEVKVDEDKVHNAGFATFTPGAIDVTIVDGGLTIAFPASFEVNNPDPEIPQTPGAVLTPADAPTVAQLIGVSDDISMLIADDVFNQIFAAMKQAGKLKSLCSPADSLHVGDLLPADCDTLLPDKDNPGQTIDTLATAALRGICHAIRGDDCLSLTGSSGAKTNTEVGTCVGFSGGDCTTLPLGQKLVCNVTPSKNLHATDGVAVCARQDMEPDLLIDQDTTLDATVNVQLILEDLNVVFMLDRDNNGYTGHLEDLPGCFSQEGNVAPDCRLYAACADLTLKAAMGIDSSTCKTREAGFIFSSPTVIPSSLDLGAMCNAANAADDSSILEQAIASKITEATAQHAHDFMPAICVEGLDLGGVLNFSSADAKLFGFTTNGGTGFADFLGITVGLGTP